MHYAFSSHTDRGRVRANNEDAVRVAPARGLALLADGMGGYNAGEVASSMAVSVVDAQLAQRLPAPATPASLLAATPPAVTPIALRDALQASVDAANRAILDAAAATPAYRGMGTTLVVALFRGPLLYLGHIGDSRGYRWRGGRLQQLTRDHSLLQEQLDAGLITPQQAATSPQRNLITRALGVEPGVRLDISEVPVQADDCFLLCSDGLTDMLDDAAIAQLLARPWPPGQPGLDRLAAALVDEANACGGRDNISVLLVRAGAD